MEKGSLWIWVNAKNNLLSWGRPFHISSQTTLEGKKEWKKKSQWPENFGFNLHENQETFEIKTH